MTITTLAVQFELDTILIPLVEIPPGEFLMGSDNDLYSEGPRHRVCIPKGFWIGQTPITQAQWTAVVGDNPSQFQGDPAQPVDSVSWDMAMDFCERLGKQCGRAVGLPSEAQWEYACLAGTTDEFFCYSGEPFRDDTDVTSAVRERLREYVWFEDTSQQRTWPVRQKPPNPWGLHDMIGQVWEWCLDVWHDSYAGAPVDGSANLANAENQPRRVCAVEPGTATGSAVGPATGASIDASSVRIALGCGSWWEIEFRERSVCVDTFEQKV